MRPSIRAILTVFGSVSLVSACHSQTSREQLDNDTRVNYLSLREPADQKRAAALLREVYRPGKG